MEPRSLLTLSCLWDCQCTRGQGGLGITLQQSGLMARQGRKPALKPETVVAKGQSVNLNPGPGVPASRPHLSCAGAVSAPDSSGPHSWEPWESRGHALATSPPDRSLPVDSRVGCGTINWISESRSVVSDSEIPCTNTVHGILQARILEWVAFSFSSGSSQPRNWTGVSCTAGRFFTNWAIREAL